MTLKLFMYSLARPSAGPGGRESEASSEARVAVGRPGPRARGIKSAHDGCVQFTTLLTHLDTDGHVCVTTMRYSIP